MGKPAGMGRLLMRKLGRGPSFKKTKLIWGIALLVYTIALATMIIPFFRDIDQKISIAQRPESARYDARWER